MSDPLGSRKPSGLEKRLAQRAKTARSVGFYTAIPTMMVVGPVLGYLLGAWLERKFGYEPWFVFTFVLLGGIASVRQVVLILNRANAAAARERKSRDQPPN